MNTTLIAGMLLAYTAALSLLIRKACSGSKSYLAEKTLCSLCFVAVAAVSARMGSRPEAFVHLAPALGERFDLVFIDGDKREYPDYYRMLMGDRDGCPLVHAGSILLADNILWSGKVVEPLAHGDWHTRALLEFNRMVVEDPRVENVIVPLRDGLNLIRVR